MTVNEWFSGGGATFLLALCLLPSGPALGADCNANGIDDACDVDCENTGCSGVLGCGASQDCNANGVPDECEVTVLYAGTQGGRDGGGAKVLRYAGGTNWVVLTLSDWPVSAVMDLAFFDGYLYAGVQTKPGYGGGGADGSGPVCGCDEEADSESDCSCRAPRKCYNTDGHQRWGS